jgi:hypothetical protein
MTRLTPESNPVKLFHRILRQYDVNVGVLNGVYANFGVKSFTRLGPGANVIKLFTAVSYAFS